MANWKRATVSFETETKICTNRCSMESTVWIKFNNEFWNSVVISNVVIVVCFYSTRGFRHHFIKFKIILLLWNASNVRSLTANISFRSKWAQQRSDKISLLSPAKAVWRFCPFERYCFSIRKRVAYASRTRWNRLRVFQTMDWKWMVCLWPIGLNYR